MSDLNRVSELLGVTVLQVRRDLPGHDPSRQQWDATQRRWVAADEHAGPPGERQPAKQRWHLLIQREGEAPVWVHWTSAEVKETVRKVKPETPRAGRSALALLHNTIDSKEKETWVPSKTEPSQ